VLFGGVKRVKAAYLRQEALEVADVVGHQAGQGAGIGQPHRNDMDARGYGQGFDFQKDSMCKFQKSQRRKGIRCGPTCVVFTFYEYICNVAV
jgi:hypothetical protein